MSNAGELGGTAGDDVGSLAAVVGAGGGSWELGGS